MRTPLVILMVLVTFVSGTTFAIAGGNGGNGGNGNNSPPGHRLKPGCGPDKTDGVAGNSGRHTGQPPKADNRQDCPNPPGQQNTANTSSGKKK